MNDYDEKLDRVLNHALELYEQGKSVEEILDLHKNFREDLQKFFDAIKWVENRKTDINPSKTILNNILFNINAVIKPDISSNVTKEAGKGRASWTKKLTHQIQLFMQMNWKVAATGVVALLIVVFLFQRTGQTPTQNTPTPQPSPAPIGGRVSATGDVDDSVDAILSASASEQATIEENDEAALYNSESSAMSEFGQSFNVNEF